MNTIRMVVSAFGMVTLLSSSLVGAQTAAPAQQGTPIMVQMPDGTYRQAIAVQPAAAVEPKVEPKQFAFTTNPLNLFIGRYGLNFEYQPTPHHGVIVSPHYDHVNADVNASAPSTDSSVTYKDTFSGVGAELGYRFYTGDKGFNGFFVSPSLLLATYKTSGNLLGESMNSSFSSIGFAWEIGGQAQLGGGFVIGGGGGMQYTNVSKDIDGLPIAAAIIAGGGWRPRFLFNLGYAF